MDDLTSPAAETDDGLGHRYIVIGAGAVGGTIGGRLAQAGRDVVLVARGEHLEHLAARGLHLRLPDGGLTYHLPAVPGPAPLGELTARDVLLLTVKVQDTEAALADWSAAPVAGGGTAAERLPLVCLQNGVESPRLAMRRFRHVYAACVWLPSTFVEPGVISAYGAPCSGVLHLGRYPHGVDDVVRGIARDLRASRFDVPVVPDVARWRYAKLLSNLNNAVEAVSGPVDSSESRALCARLRAEGEAVLAAAGIAYTSPEEEQEARDGKATLVPVDGVPRGGGSAWQSLARSTGSIEADHLNGEIALLGRLHNVPTPLNELLQRLANGCARERLPAGATPVRTLVRMADTVAGTLM
ncbi:2-dehydropantoate 2-reductase N-terminal domain-containing protein [Streptomyces sp. NPDC051014]|uniref:ketopantoate reductase family protein n=1 Tax=Streptomyces sp. NPDC051014 TaxID=3155751 RepID=UPI0033C89886